MRNTDESYSSKQEEIEVDLLRLSRTGCTESDSIWTLLNVSAVLWGCLSLRLLEFDTLTGTSWCIQVHILNSVTSTQIAMKVF